MRSAIHIISCCAQQQAIISALGSIIHRSPFEMDTDTRTRRREHKEAKLFDSETQAHQGMTEGSNATHPSSRHDKQRQEKMKQEGQKLVGFVVGILVGISLLYWANNSPLARRKTAHPKVLESSNIFLPSSCCIQLHALSQTQSAATSLVFSDQAGQPDLGLIDVSTGSVSSESAKANTIVLPGHAVPSSEGKAKYHEPMFSASTESSSTKISNE